MERSRLVLVEVAVTLTTLGNTYGVLGEVHQSKALLERALAILEAYYGKNHVAVAATLTNLGIAYEVLGDVHQSKALLKRSLAIEEEYYGKDHPQVTFTLFNLGTCYFHQGKFIEAFSTLQRTYDIWRRHPGCGRVSPCTLRAKQLVKAEQHFTKEEEAEEYKALALSSETPPMLSVITNKAESQPFSNNKNEITVSSPLLFSSVRLPSRGSLSLFIDDAIEEEDDVEDDNNQDRKSCGR